jgi:nicotinic acid phosphoribosyltransferase
VKTVPPFYSINNDVKFKRSFGTNYEKFKEIYLRGDVGNLEYSCNKVRKELDDLTIKGTWHDRFLDIFRSEN